MKILIIGDFHGKFPMKLQKLAKDTDLIISTGDYFSSRFTEIFLEYGEIGYELILSSLSQEEYEEIILSEIKEGIEVIEILNSLNKKVFTTVGNYDKTGINDQYGVDFKDAEKDALKNILSKRKNIKRIDYRRIEFGGIEFIGGFGHSSPGQPRSQAFLKSKKKFEKLFTEANKNPVIFVSHNLPWNCKLDIIKRGVLAGQHYGSKLIRYAIEKFNPILAIGGHFHENQGKCFIEKTLVINPGAACDGKCAIVDFDVEKGRIKNVKFIK